MRGDLLQSSLSEVVRQLYAERRSGVLHVSRQGIRRRVHFKNGVAVFADTGDNQLQSREQAELLAYSLFTWTSGRLEFEPGEPKIAESLEFEGSPSSLILEGIRRIDELEILEQLIGGHGGIFACTQSSVLPLFKMRLSPAENAILTFARDREQFMAEDLPLPSGDLSVVNALNALVGVGLLEIVNKAAAPGLTPQPSPEPVIPVHDLPVVEATSEPTPPPVNEAAPSPVEATPPPAPVATPTTTESQVTPIMPSVPSDMEQLFDTLESKRSATVQPQPAAPEPTPPAAPVTEEILKIEPPPIAPEPPTEAPAQPRPSLMAIVSSCVDVLAVLVPAGKPRFIAAGSSALIVIVALVLMLGSGNNESKRSDPVVAADSTPSAEPSTPGPESGLEVEPERSEAELFYHATLAFESGDFETSQANLTKLLELKPDLLAARELMTRVERELAPQPEPRKPTRTPRRTVRKPETEPAKPKPPTLDELLADARVALNQGDLQTAQSKLDLLEAVNASYPGAKQLQDALSDRLWEKTLPLAFTSRHDHTLGGCDGVLTLTSSGIGFRSDKHDWFWSFREIGAAERGDSQSLGIETTNGQSYNFELRDALADTDWARYQKLRSR